MLYRYNNNNVLCSSNQLLEAIFYNLWATYSCRDTSRQQSYFQSYTSMHVRRYYIYYLAISVSCVPLYYVKSYSKLMHIWREKKTNSLSKQLSDGTHKSHDSWHLVESKPLWSKTVKEKVVNWVYKTVKKQCSQWRRVVRTKIKPLRNELISCCEKQKSFIFVYIYLLQSSESSCW